MILYKEVVYNDLVGWMTLQIKANWHLENDTT